MTTASILAALTVALVAVIATVARGHWRGVTVGGVAGLGVLSALAALSAWVMTAVWQDAGGYAAAATLTGLWCYAGWYTLDPSAPPGISQRLTALVRAHWWAAVLFVALMLGFIAHVFAGWP